MGPGLPYYGFQMLETYFGPCSGLVWSSLMTISGRAARSAALYGDGFGADFRPSDVDYESLPSLIKRFEGATRSGSMRSIQWCIVIHLIHSGSWSNSRVSEFERFHLISVSRGASRFHARSPPGPPRTHMLPLDTIAWRGLPQKDKRNERTVTIA